MSGDKGWAEQDDKEKAEKANRRVEESLRDMKY